MSFWSPDNLRQVTAGRWLARPAEASALHEPVGLSIDSRTLERGEVFLALPGPRFDGHDYIADAVAR